MKLLPLPSTLCKRKHYRRRGPGDRLTPRTYIAGQPERSIRFQWDSGDLGCGEGSAWRGHVVG